MSAAAVTFPYFVQKVLSCDGRALQTFCFVLALLIYGGYGSPTPDRFGVVEGGVLALLVLAVSGRGVSAATFKTADARWIVFARIFFVVTVPVAMILAALYGNSIAMVARDAAAFLFLILPLMFLHFFKINPKPVLYAVLGLGVLFSIRSLWDVPFLGRGESLFYLANMPTVLMAAIYFICRGLQEFVVRFSLRSLPVVVALCAMGVLCVLPMIESQQRASLGVIALSVILMTSWLVYKFPRRGMLLALALGASGVLILPVLTDVYTPLAQKTELVGANMRAEEWRAVWVVLADNPVSILLGLGWGATFSSPAVADIAVNYTHGLFSSLLLKSGLAGMALGMGYIGAVLWGVLRGAFVQPAVVLAVMFPILIDVFLYASFKSLDFGVVLLCAVLYSNLVLRKKDF